MTRQPPTALYIEMRLIYAETKSIEKTAAELIRRGATPDAIRDTLYPHLRAAEQRRVDEAIADASEPRGVRGGPTVASITDDLVAWEGDWPPTQPDFAEGGLDNLSDRRLRQILNAAGTTWAVVIAEAERRRSAR